MQSKRRETDASVRVLPSTVVCVVLALDHALARRDPMDGMMNMIWIIHICDFVVILAEA